MKASLHSYRRVFVLSALSLLVSFNAFANANPAKDSNGKKGYQAFCAVFKADCTKNSAYQYEEKNSGANISCQCSIYTNEKNALHGFNQMCESRGLNHSEIKSGVSLQYKASGGGASTCYVK